MSKEIPFVGTWYSIQSIFTFGKDYVRPQLELFRRFGDRVVLTKVPFAFVLVYHPNDVEHVLRTNQKNYLKADEMKQLQPVLGQGLVTSEGDLWKRHRKAVAPEFSSKHMVGFYEVFKKYTEEFLAKHQTEACLHVNTEISELAYFIGGECFFGAEMKENADVVYQGIDLASRLALKRMARPINPPYHWKLPSHVKVHNAVGKMNDIVYRIIDDRKKSPNSDRSDALTRLLKVKSEDGQPYFTDEEVRDEVMTLMIAGHETSANAISWALYLLSEHPGYQKAVREEAQRVYSGAVPEFEDLEKLKFTRQVINEAMRLYPPIPMLSRKAIDEDEMSGYRVPKNSRMGICQFIVHRHPEFWQKPEEFLPERFEDESKIYPYSFFPFGGGARECIGKQLAMSEMSLILSSFTKAFEYSLATKNVTFEPLVTLRPTPEVVLKLTPLKNS